MKESAMPLNNFDKFLLKITSSRGTMHYTQNHPDKPVLP